MAKLSNMTHAASRRRALNTKIRCTRCAERGEEHDPRSGGCPPKGARFPSFPKVDADDTDESRAIAKFGRIIESYWASGPGTTFERRT